MTILILGLWLFLGVHSVRIFADPWRSRTIEKYGLLRWKAVYTLISLTGLILIIYGYALARQQPIQLWPAPTAAKHIASLLTLVAFILLAAAYIPKNWIQARLRHPMLIAVKVWAFAHLLANGTLADLMLFGSFLLWALLTLRACKSRDHMQGRHTYTVPSALPTFISIVVGTLAWAAFAFWAHAWLIGVSPFAA